MSMSAIALILAGLLFAPILIAAMGTIMVGFGRAWRRLQ